MRLLGLTFVAGLLGSTTAAMAEGIATRPIDFARDIRPVLEGSCLSCHGVSEPQGQLRLTSQRAAMKGGFSGPAIVPGKPDESLLYQRLTSADEDERMPHDAVPLPPESIALFRSWIEQGAVWPAAEQETAVTIAPHRAYMKPVRPRPPVVARRDWVRNPIDAFVLTRLEQEGIAPSSAATKEQLIRRVHLDLIHSLPNLCLETDRACAALVRDLKDRGLLDSTLVVWGGEFGRTPMVENRADIQNRLLGRDHHPHAFSMWLAGGGIRTGIAIGQTDDFGYRIAERPIHVHDLHATLLHLLGLDHTRLTYRVQGRDFRLTDVAGHVIEELV